MNRIINTRCWNDCETLFSFNQYGEAKAGHYIIDTVNVAIGVKNLVNRQSGGGFALHMYNVYAERLMSLGTWYTRETGMIFQYHFIG